jgi:anti-sigma B factor antagonist
MFKIHFEEENINQYDVCTIYYSGALDSNHALDLYDLIQSELNKKINFFLVDCSEMEYISSFGISILYKIKQKLKEHDSEIIFYSINEEIDLIFKFLKLADLILITENKESAIDKLFDPDKEEIIAEELVYSMTTPEEVVLEQDIPTEEFSPIQIQFTDDKAVSNPSIKVNRLMMTDEEYSLEEVKTAELDAIQEEIKLETKKETLPVSQVQPAEELKIKVPFFNKVNIDPKQTSILDSITDFETEQTDEYDLQSLSNRVDPNFTVLVVNCGNCGAKIRIRKQGKQKCPSCGYKFILRQSGSISTIEKLN